MSKPIVTGLLSYGMSGRIFHAPFLASHPGFEFKAVLERNNKSAAQRYPSLESYDSIGEMLQDASIELIVVNTPNYTHFDYAMQALHAGKHVLIEKPAAVTVKQVETLFGEGRKLGLQVMIFQNRRFNSDFLSAKEVIESGRLGNLIEVHFRIDRYRIAIGNKPFKEDKAFPGNGLLYDLGSHLLDGAISLFGKPTSYRKTTAVHRPGSVVDDYFHFHLSYPNQLNVYLSSGLLIAEPEYGFVVHGTSGSFLKMRTDLQESQITGGMLPNETDFGIEPEGAEGKLVIIDGQGQKSTTLLKSPRGDYQGIFEAVYQTIRNQAAFPVSEDEVLWQMEMLEG